MRRIVEGRNRFVARGIVRLAYHVRQKHLFSIDEEKLRKNKNEAKPVNMVTPRIYATMLCTPSYEWFKFCI